jgi:hypothetical protein
MKKLGKVEKLPLREIWKHEALDFTKWLAEEENLAILSEEISIDLSLIATEHSVGSFNVDIYCENQQTGKKVIIENQLERTDHDHLGKIITYGAGVDASHIIWIVSEVREEHQSAIEWLNRITNENVNFFLIKMELWKIGNSEPAPIFNIIEQPNNWNKNINTDSSSKENTERKKFFLEFWPLFNDKIEEYSKYFKKSKVAPTNYWYNLRMGTSKAHISIEAIQRLSEIRVSIYIDDQNSIDTILSKKEDIEKEIGFSLDLKENSNYIRIFKAVDINLNDKLTWDKTIKELINIADLFRANFLKFIKLN